MCLSLRVEGIHSWRVVLINKWKCYYKLQNVSVARVEGIHSWRVVHINKWKCYYKLQNVSVKEYIVGELKEAT